MTERTSARIAYDDISSPSVFNESQNIGIGSEKNGECRLRSENLRIKVNHIDKRIQILDFQLNPPLPVFRLVTRQYRRYYGKGDDIYQQDNTPCHKGEIVREYSSEFQVMS
ncbi:hypothetical protein TNCV_3165371 [Trichonephila clavipes]|nr:hypothetical protein TNCV_3165371 [Trichonephila clavipes]